jgi:hypothetical protein
MYNIAKPTPDDLPTSKQLLRSTLIALVTAIAILFTVVLPSEYAIDPTGIGRVLGLTVMGEIKTQLAEEAAIDAAMGAAAARAAVQPAAPPDTGASSVTAQPAPIPLPTADSWRDEMQVVLTPGQGTEIKLVMQAGERAEFSWVAQGGVVNFDTHGDGGGQSISYEKGRSVSSDEGVLEAAFDGNHGWFWRNRGDSNVTVIIRARGQYSEMKPVI